MENGMSERDETITEMINEDRERLKRNLAEAVLKLGGIINIQTDAPIIDIISEDICYTANAEGCKFTCLGVDLTDKIQALQIHHKAGAFPIFNLYMGNSGVHLRISDEELADMSKKKRAG